MKKLFSALFVAVLSFCVISAAFAGQGPNQSYAAVNTSGFAAPLYLGTDGGLRTASGGISRALNVTTSTVVKASAGRLIRIIVSVAGSAGNVYDSATSGTSANLIATIPAVIGIYDIEFPVTTGILVVPGALQVVSVSYN